MVLDAKRYKIEDQVAASRIAAKLDLEYYKYDLRHSLNKLDSYNREMLRTAIESTKIWLDANQEATKEEFEGNVYRKECSLKSPLREVPVLSPSLPLLPPTLYIL